MRKIFPNLAAGAVLLALGASWHLGLAAPPASNAAPPTNNAVPTATDSLAASDALRQFSEGSQELYQRVARSFIRVKIDESAEGLLPTALRGDFDAWKDQMIKEGKLGPGGDGPSAQPTPPAPPGPPRRPRRDNAPAGTQPTTRPARTPLPPNAMFVGRFLEQRIRDAQDPEMLARLRYAMVRLDALRTGQNGEVLGVAISPEGEALVLTALSDQDKKIVVTLPDGKDGTAKLVGTNYLRGYSLLRVEPRPEAFVPLTETKTEQGELLLSVSANRGAVSWIGAAAPITQRGRRGLEEHFAVAGGDEHSGAYLFNINGELAGVSLGHHATQADMLKRELDWLRRTGGMPQRSLGFKCDLVLPNAPLRSLNKNLGVRPALEVKEVTPDSAAAKAGIKVGDILLKIDGAPISREAIQRLLPELLTRTAPLQFELLRGDDTKTIDVPMPKPVSEKPGT